MTILSIRTNTDEDMMQHCMGGVSYDSSMIEATVEHDNQIYFVLYTRFTQFGRFFVTPFSVFDNWQYLFDVDQDAELAKIEKIAILDFEAELDTQAYEFYLHTSVADHSCNADQLAELTAAQIPEKHKDTPFRDVMCFLVKAMEKESGTRQDLMTFAAECGLDVER